MNIIASATTTGQPVSIPNYTQARESTNDIGKKNELTIGKSVSNEENTASLKSKGKKGPRRHVKYWDKMYRKLVEYKDANDGSIEIQEIPEEEKDNPGMKNRESLRIWCNTQAQLQRRCSQGHTDAGNLTTEKIEKLREVGFPLDPSYDEMYEKVATHKAETGTLDVNKDDDEELFAWVKEQKKMLALFFRGKPVALSDDRIQNLRSLGFEQSRPGKGPSSVVDAGSAEKKWESMLEALLKYKEEHGSLSFPGEASSLPKPVRQVKNWLAAQRKECKNLQQGKESSLTARRMQRLTATGLDLSPRTEHIPWEQRMQSLREFVSEHGHCKPNKQHPLASFVNNIRHFYWEREAGKATCLTDERVNDLMGVGFVFKAGKSPNITAIVRKSWEERFQELLAFKEEHGHTLVPQLSGPLGVWVKEQRTHYRRMKAGQKTPMTAEKALRLTEIGFHFDAARFKGPNREVE